MVSFLLLGELIDGDFVVANVGPVLAFGENLGAFNMQNATLKKS